MAYFIAHSTTVHFDDTIFDLLRTLSKQVSTDTGFKLTLDRFGSLYCTWLVRPYVLLGFPESVIQEQLSRDLPLPWYAFENESDFADLPDDYQFIPFYSIVPDSYWDSYTYRKTLEQLPEVSLQCSHTIRPTFLSSDVVVFSPFTVTSHFVTVVLALLKALTHILGTEIGGFIVFEPETKQVKFVLPGQFFKRSSVSVAWTYQNFPRSWVLLADVHTHPFEVVSGFRARFSSTDEMCIRTARCLGIVFNTGNVNTPLEQCVASLNQHFYNSITGYPMTTQSPILFSPGVLRARIAKYTSQLRKSKWFRDLVKAACKHVRAVTVDTDLDTGARHRKGVQP